MTIREGEVMRLKKVFPLLVAMAVTALFLLPGLALGDSPNGANGDDDRKCPPASPRGNPPPEDPPRKCGHPDSSTSETATSETATSETATSETATSETATSETATSETATSETATSETATSGGVECEGFVHIADNEVIADSAPLIDGVLGIHVDLLPANASVNLARACVGLGSVAALGVDCAGPIAVEPDESSGLFICVEA
jgi:hypothetical protein